MVLLDLGDLKKCISGKDIAFYIQLLLGSESNNVTLPSKVSDKTME